MRTMKTKHWRTVHVSWVPEDPAIELVESSTPGPRPLLAPALPTVSDVCSADRWVVEGYRHATVDPHPTGSDANLHRLTGDPGVDHVVLVHTSRTAPWNLHDHTALLLLLDRECVVGHQ